MLHTFEIVSLSGTHIVTIETQPANGDPSYTVYHSTPESALHVGGLVSPQTTLKKLITKQARSMWIAVESVKEIK
jgi:hypothetical protein